MKQRHIITLAIIAGIISCTGDVPKNEHDEEPGTTEPQDTTSTGYPPNTKPWETEVDTTIFITGQPTE